MGFQKNSWLRNNRKLMPNGKRRNWKRSERSNWQFATSSSRRQRRKKKVTPAEDAEKKDDNEKKDGMEVDSEKKEEKEDAKPEDKDENKEASDAKEEEEETEPPKVELSEDEKAQAFTIFSVKDLSPQVTNQFMRQFSIPDKGEGFDRVEFEWEDDDASAVYLKTRVQEQKILARLDELQPGQWFTEKLATWKKQIEEWQTKQKEFQAKQESTKKDKKEGEEDQEDEEMKGVDIFSVEDVCDVGGGEPLFSSFQPEDWKLMELRYEMYLLCQGFKRDVADDEHPGIHESHLVYYYGKYLKKGITIKYYGKETNKEALDLVKDTMSINDKDMVTTQLSADVETPEIILKLTEESRRERQRRIDAGDETARLKFSPLLYKPQPVQMAPVMMPPDSDQPDLKGGWPPKGKGWPKGWGK